MKKVSAVIIDDKAEFYRDELVDAFPQINFLTAHNARDAEQYAAEAEVLIGAAVSIPRHLIEMMPNLKWIHSLTTGAEKLIALQSEGLEFALTNTRGAHGPQMSELTIMLMMTLQRRFPEMQNNQRNHQWIRWQQPLLLGKKVCVVGIGAIAQVLAQYCAVFGLDMIGVSDGRQQVGGFSAIYPRAKLLDAVSRADFVVVLTPYSSKNHHVVSDLVLEAMKPSAYLINISRGLCIDESALLRHLHAGSIAGAGIDVAEIEPLPADSPLWSAPNLIITPHIGGSSSTIIHQTLPMVSRNIGAYLKTGVDALPDKIGAWFQA